MMRFLLECADLLDTASNITGDADFETECYNAAEKLRELAKRKEVTPPMATKPKPKPAPKKPASKKTAKKA